MFYGYNNFGFDNDEFHKVMRLFGQLKQPFDELEISIDEQMEEKFKINIIYEFIHSAWWPSRPIKSIKETAELYKSLKCLDKMAYYISKHENISKEVAKAKLKQIVKENKHFKRAIK